MLLESPRFIENLAENQCCPQVASVSEYRSERVSLRGGLRRFPSPSLNPRGERDRTDWISLFLRLSVGRRKGWRLEGLCFRCRPRPLFDCVDLPLNLPENVTEGLGLPVVLSDSFLASCGIWGFVSWFRGPTCALFCLAFRSTLATGFRRLLDPAAKPADEGDEDHRYIDPGDVVHKWLEKVPTFSVRIEVSCQLRPPRRHSPQ